MTKPIVTDEKFIALWQELGSPQAVAKETGMEVRGVYRRRNHLLSKGIPLPTTNKSNRAIRYDSEEVKAKVQYRLEATVHNARRGINLEKGRVVVFSDAHFYPDDETTAYRALIEYIKEFKPELVIANGDIFDGTTASRHPRINWSDAPTIKEELEACKHFMAGIENASRFKENLIWTLGNHDARFETFLSNQIGQYQGIDGFCLKDHFPLWKSCWSYWINDHTVIKHRWKGGFNAGRANSLNSGVNFVTGHTHQLKVEPITDYNGTRYGIQTGTLANPDGDQFIHYTEDNPKDWRSGFVVLTFDRGQLLMPELVQVWDEKESEVQFRGKIYKV